jgi:spore germination protein KC
MNIGRGRGRRLGRAARAGLLLVILPLCVGCTQLLSVNEDALVTGVALDAGTQPGQVAVAMQWVHPPSPASSASGGGLGGGGGNGGSQVTTVTGSGPDVAEAVAGIRAQADQNIVVFSVNLVVVGDALARRGLAGPLDYVWRDGAFPETAQFTVARGSAAKLLATHYPGGTAFELSRRLVRSGGSDTGSIPIPVWRFLARTDASGEAAWAPVFAPTGKGFRADGTALFAGDRMTGEIGQGGTAALGWLIKEGGYGDLLLPGVVSAGEPVALHVRSRRLRVSVPGPTDAQVQLTLSTEVRQGAGLLLQNRSPARLEAEASGQARRDVRAVLDRLQAAGSDVLGLGEVLRERDPAAVRDWPRSFRRMRIALQVRVRIVTGGRGA